MLRAPSDAAAETVLADLALSSEFGKRNANLGAVLLEWGAGPRSSTFDLHVQLFTPVHTAIHITGKGGGVISNTVRELKLSLACFLMPMMTSDFPIVRAGSLCLQPPEDYM
eukprot:SAG22_NODE_275_length_13171_cov_11.640606_4_plen_111_part_00